MNRKICYVCSSGGHFDEMAHAREKMEAMDSFVITEDTEGRFSYQNHTYYVGVLMRNDPLWMLKMLGLFFRGIMIFIREKPAVVISFGAMVTLPFCFAAKMMGIRIAYVESIARVKSLSLTGKIMYLFADLFVVQWENLLREYPRAVYGGWVYW